MSVGRYRVSVNGFRVMAETWDDALQWDGKRDEVFISSQVAVVDKSGNQLFSNQPTSPVMGDTWGQNGRIQAGSGGDRGGLRTGDSFPSNTPWRRAVPLDEDRDWPPTVIWEGELVSGENVALITPTIWEWDPGGDFFSGWLRWGNEQLQAIAPKVKELTGGTGAVVVDAVSLGLGVAVSMFDVGGPMGSSGSRPIGMQRDGANPKTFTFNPQVLVLNYDTAELLANSEPSGRGKGVLTLRFAEDPLFRGEYLLFVQVERIGGPPTEHDASWESLGGRLSSGPSAASWSEGRLDVFSRDVDNSLAHKWYENGWSDWESLGGVLESDPAAVSWDTGRVDVVTRGTDNALWHKWYENGWSDWESLGGILTSGPSICSWSPGRLDIFTRGTDKALWHKWYENGWSDWESLGDSLNPTPLRCLGHQDGSTCSAAALIRRSSTNGSRTAGRTGSHWAGSSRRGRRQPLGAQVDSMSLGTPRMRCRTSGLKADGQLGRLSARSRSPQTQMLSLGAQVASTCLPGEVTTPSATSGTTEHGDRERCLKIAQ